MHAFVFRSLVVLGSLCLTLHGATPDGSQPPPPPSLGGVLNQMVTIVERMVPPANNAAVMQAMTQDGIQEAEEQIETSQQDSIVTKVVKTLVAARLNPYVKTGMCMRNYTQACPVGWTETRAVDETISCLSPTVEGEESGSDEQASVIMQVKREECSEYNVTTSFTPPNKEKFSIKCKVEWPCAACKRNFEDCPNQFRRKHPDVAGLCVPQASYAGPCNDRMDFRLAPDTREKARWAARCYTSWPCSGE